MLIVEKEKMERLCGSMHNCGIYSIRNKSTNKIYIGCSKNIKDRWKTHCKKLRNRISLINRAIQKYGKDNFEFTILLECPSMCFNYWEQYYIKIYNTMTPNGYNLTSGGEYKKTYSNETRKKISNSSKGRTITELCKSRASKVNSGNSYAKGHLHTEEWKNNMSTILRGVKHTTEHVENNRKSQLGKKLSESTKAKIGIASKNRITTDSARINMSTAQLGRKHSDETKQKMKEAHLKRFASIGGER